MKYAQRLLFGNGFPRSVASSKNGELLQFYVHSESEFDLFFDKVRKNRNVYSSTCRFRSDMRPVLDKIFFDFDSAKKDTVFGGNISDRKKVEKMANDRDLLYTVLGNVWDDVNSLIEYCFFNDIPAVTVFSGMGFHVHLLYQEEVSPVDKKRTTSHMLIDKCDLETYDRTVITDVRRILRVPNAQRVDGEPTGLWTIPLSENEVLEWELEDVFDASFSPKPLDEDKRYAVENRPKMKHYEEYEQESSEEYQSRRMEARDISEEVDSLSEYIVDNSVLMPCVSERIKQSNPDHQIRLNYAIHMLNAGWSVEEIVQISSGLNWIDFDADKTRKFVKHAKEKKYSEFPCQTMFNRGFCVEEEEPEECESYGWRGGEAFF